ncbi:SoxR reducing system RseC family protein [Oceanobacter kriegii]|uniref:SoxR reducing system RseC family protein n=1 Tax=Oceanobacter kriegii TaxID=64972 RepID=UPI000685A044|nr:SoxR reducing system RseC family protein [Oceanobacter kriegii]
MAQESVLVADVGDGGVWVESVQRSSCGSCQAKSGCGQSALESIGRPVRLWVATDLKLEAGQQVTLDLPDGSLMSSALALYGIPMVGLILGAVAGQTAGGESASMLVGLLGLLFGFGAARWLSNQRKGQWLPRIVAVAEPGTTMTITASEHLKG